MSDRDTVEKLVKVQKCLKNLSGTKRDKMLDSLVLMYENTDQNETIVGVFAYILSKYGDQGPDIANLFASLDHAGSYLLDDPQETDFELHMIGFLQHFGHSLTIKWYKNTDDKEGALDTLAYTYQKYKYSVDVLRAIVGACLRYQKEEYDDLLLTKFQELYVRVDKNEFLRYAQLFDTDEFQKLLNDYPIVKTWVFD